jgi:mycothiol synthase
VIPAPTLLTSLSPEDVAHVGDLLVAARAADGGEPVSEEARLALGTGERPGTAHLVLAGARGEDPAAAPAGPLLLGYAQLRSVPGDPGAGVTAELLVAPSARGRGVGTALAAASEEAATRLGSGPLRAWSHVDSPAAAALAARRGYRRARELWRMSRPLGDGAPPLPPVELPGLVLLRPFEEGRDEQAWLDLNARAFAAHPEQGRWTAEDLRARQREPWWDPRGIVLAEDAGDGRLLASHWTKEPGDGTAEVYVVGVDPAAQGRGLGGVVTLAGLHLLADRGHRRVHLYVEGDNTAAQRVYTRLGFSHDGSDVLYERAAPGGSAEA